VLRHDLSAGILAAAQQRLPGAPSITLGTYAGTGDADFFAGSARNVVALGRPAVVSSAGAGDGPPGLAMSFDFAPTIELVKKLESNGVTYGLDPLLPKWRTEAPRLTLTAKPEGKEWLATLSFTAAALPFHSIDPSIAACARANRHLRIAAGVDPRAVSGLMTNLMGVGEERALTQLLGASIGEVAGLFTGDLLLMLDSSGILPQGAVVLLLREGADASSLLRNLSEAYHGQPLQLEGAVTAYTLETPVGPLAIASDGKRLVLGNDPELGQTLLAGKPGDGAIAAGTFLAVDIDLPLLSRQWLPVAYRLLAEQRLELGTDILANLRFSLPEAALALHQTQGAGALSRLVADDLPQLTLTRNAVTQPWTVSPAMLANELRALAPTDKPAEMLDHAFAFYANPNSDDTATVYRTADGFHVCEEERRGKRQAFTAQQLATRVAGMQLVMGADPATMKALTPPERPVFDRRCLPDLATLLRHIPAYRLEGKATATGVILEERGAPVGAIATCLGLLNLSLFEQPRMLRYHRMMSEGREQPPAAATPPGLVDF
jgi:hypothetical protein